MEEMVVLVYFSSLILHLKETQNKGQSLTFPCAVCFSVGGIKGVIYWMTSSDCIWGWKHSDLKHPLTTGKPFTSNHLALDKCLIIFNSGSAKNLQIACKVTDCFCISMCMPLQMFVGVYLCMCVNDYMIKNVLVCLCS